MHPFDWSVEHSHHVVQDTWISLRADACRMPDGTPVAPYYVLEYPDWVSVVALTPAREVVMVRQYRHGAGRTLLELPCGRVDDEDASPEDTARRELLEETGYGNGVWTPTGVMFANASSHRNRLHTFAVTGVEPVGPQRLDASEQIEVELVPWESLLEMLDDPGVTFPASLHAAVYSALRHLPLD